MAGSVSRRDFVKALGAGAAALGLGHQLDVGSSVAPEQAVSAVPATATKVSKELAGIGDQRPNILYFQIDNLGIGELGCYGGGILRGADTRRIDQFATQGTKLLNFAPEAQCTPSRAALMTGRYSIRSGCHTIPFAGQDAGLVAWERTMGDVLSDAGYACACYGKWHVGESDGRWPTDHGFDEWYGPIRSYDECLWPTHPEYDPGRDVHSPVLEGYKGKGAQPVIDILTVDVRRDIDLKYLKRAEAFLRGSVTRGAPFYLYFNHSMMHMPTVPRKEYQGKSGYGDWADSLLELDGDFGKLLDLLDQLGIANNTIVVLAGDNGAEDTLPWRGTSGYWEGSYFTGMEGSLRTPCLVRWPGRVPANRQSDEIVHITDMFTTLVRWAGSEIPLDRVIDGLDQRAFLEGETDASAREGFLFWNGARSCGAKWRHFKGMLVEQKAMWDPVLEYTVPHIYNLKLDPKERENMAVHYGWVAAHVGRMSGEFAASTKRESPIPAGAPVDYNPYAAQVSR
jgi:arylsulfatase A-like enzyme